MGSHSRPETPRLSRPDFRRASTVALHLNAALFGTAADSWPSLPEMMVRFQGNPRADARLLWVPLQLKQNLSLQKVIYLAFLYLQIES